MEIYFQHKLFSKFH